MAPLKAPNTDGIDPGMLFHTPPLVYHDLDIFHRAELVNKTRKLVCFWLIILYDVSDSSINVCIEDCYIESGDDLVAVKSGWDQYGIRMARPSSNIIVRKVSGTTPTCSGVGIGSEMSGGISNVTIEDLHIRDSSAGVRIKSDKGRGGYIANVSISNIKMERVKIPIKFSRGSNDHPDKGYDSKAVPKVKGIFISNILSLNSTKAPVLQGIEGASFEEICFKNVTVLGLASSESWHCEFVSGFSIGVFPVPCPQLKNDGFSFHCS